MRSLLFTLFVCCAALCSAQTGEMRPFCENGKVWTKDYCNVLNQMKWYHNVTKLDGDTIIGSHTCMKAYVNGTYRGAFFDEGCRTFYIRPNSTEKKLVYDFALEEGDEVTATILVADKEHKMKVVAVDYVDYGASHLKRITLADGEERFEWIEGVGHKYGPLQSWCYDLPGNAKYPQVSLCSVNGSFLFWGDEKSMPQVERTPFTAEGKHWLVRNSVTKEERHYSMSGDTIIAGQCAKRMFCGEEYVGAFYDYDNKTYFFLKGNEAAFLYYNFAITSDADRTTLWHNGRWAQLFNKGMDDMAHFRLRFMYVENGDDNADASGCDILNTESCEWIEGIGSLRGPMANFALHDTMEYADELFACWAPNGMLYDPHNLAGLRDVLNAECSLATTYDLSGRKLSGDTNHHGVVIENGRKVMR